MADASLSRRLAKLLPLVLATAIGAGATVAVFFSFRGAETGRLRSDFESMAMDRAQAIRSGLNEDLVELNLLGSYVAASTELAEERMGAFAEEFGRFARRIPGIEPENQVITFISRVPEAQRARFELQARKDIAPGFVIRDQAAGGDLVAADRRGEYFPVTVVEPVENNDPLVGFDLATIASLREAIRQAIATKKIAASARTTLPPTAAEGPFIWHFLAVYRTEPVPGTPVSRGEMIGLVASAVRIDLQVELALKNLSPAGIDLELMDSAAPAGQKLIYYHKSRTPGYVASMVVKNGMTWSDTFDAGGRTWTLNAYPTTSFISRHRTWLSWVLLAGGALLTILAGFYFWGRLRRVSVTEQLVAARTKDLAQEIAKHERLERELAESRSTLAGQVDRLNLRTREIQLLNELGDTLQSCVSTEEAYPVISLYLPRLLPGSSGALYMHDVARDVYATSSEWGSAPPTTAAFKAEDCWALRRGRIHAVTSAAVSLPCRHAPGAKESGSLCIPIAAIGKTIGLFHVTSCAEEANTFALSVADRVGLSLSNLMLRSDLRQLSIHDPLTSLFNRRYMEETLEIETRRAERADHRIGVIMLDIDHFKAFNDGFGHAAGDELLRALGALMLGHLRAGDIACRYGGEEFVLILPDASEDATARRAEDLRMRAKKLEVRSLERPLGPITISLGVAVYPEHGRSRNELLEAADAALYRAKQAGRDRVVIAGTEEGQRASEVVT